MKIKYNVQTVITYKIVNESTWATVIEGLDEATANKMCLALSREQEKFEQEAEDKIKKALNKPESL